MASGAIPSLRNGGVDDVLFALAHAEGTASHGYPTSPILLTGVQGSRNLADAVHMLCVLHGRHPGVIDLAADHTQGAHAILTDATDSFADERGYLTKLVVAAGPLPSTPGQAESEAAVQGQRHAIEMLAGSDRTGCALGTALALLLDWRAVRGVLDAAAVRFGIDSPAMTLPEPDAIRTALADLPPAAERAVTFGAHQLLVQHRGLWDLLEAREVARREG